MSDSTTMPGTPEHRKAAVVVGGGPVACLAAISLAKRGWKVELYEARPGTDALHLLPFTHRLLTLSRVCILDLRLKSSTVTAPLRSINLAISHRGLAAIQAIDPEAAERFLKTVIPMKARMVHNSNGRTNSQPYDKDGQVWIPALLFRHPQ